ncbi:MAG: ATP-binding protein [Candidatus Methanomethylophilaceae archaeon]|nr:ATP-binding protein [Candidatus Methanomethylophilaceae archaeon]
MKIIRKDYLDILFSSRDMPSTVKVLTGMRRTGKTTILEQYVDLLSSEGISEASICHINLDLQVKEPDLEWLQSQIEPTLKTGGMHYILIDEIQDVEGWERLVAMLVARGDCDVYITGSNSRMLSSELSTKLSGRFIEIDILPLSFREYLELHPGEMEKRFGDYLTYGGLPMIDPDRGEEICMYQSEGVFNTVLMKDVLARIPGNPRRLTAICSFLYSNVGNITNPDRISEALGIPKDDVYKYIDGIISAHLFYHADRYDIVGKKHLSSKGKYYATDLGMRNMLLNPGDLKDLSRPLENAVFFELLRRGYKVSVGSYKDSEIDFTAKKADEILYYQVTQTMLAEETMAREIRPLSRIPDNYRKIILTTDRFGLGSHEGIDVVNVMDWLCGDRANDILRINPPGMAFDGRASIVDIDEDERTVVFDVYRFKKITGTRMGPILGKSDFSSPFKIACEIAGLYPGDKPNKYLEAGNVIEPILRNYLAKNVVQLLQGPMGLGDGVKVGVEEPVEKELCGYDHFHDNKVFGGLVDGYIQVDGKRDTILEIKTSHDRSKWLDADGNVTVVPESYILQASLYAELSRLDRIVFLVGFLEDEDYDRPKFWVPTPENTAIIVMDKMDMKEPMRLCEEWYNEYIKGGYTPEWTDSPTDQEVLKYLKAYKPGKPGKRRRVYYPTRGLRIHGSQGRRHQGYESRRQANERRRGREGHRDRQEGDRQGVQGAEGRGEDRLPRQVQVGARGVKKKRASGESPDA